MPNGETPSNAREAILSAGLGLFASTRLTDVTAQGIADAAGTTPTSFYYHFRSRDDVLCHLLEELGQEVVGLVEEAVETAENDRAVAKLALEVVVAWVLREPLRARVFFDRSKGTSYDVERVRRSIDRKIQGTLVSACAEPGDPSVNDVIAARFTISTIKEIVTRVLSGTAVEEALPIGYRLLDVAYAK
jgi:AcrR family transcriptional regulator